MGKKYILFLGLIVLHFIFTSCKVNQQEEKKELLIYCGITMIRPMTEIKQIIEKQENCHIEISKGGSGNLLNAIEQNGVGDLYLPGSESYIYTAFKKGIITDTATVGHNKLAVIVQKGNPLNIKAEIQSLTSKDYYVVIGNPSSGSVGKATKKLLVSEGVFQEVEQNAIRFTTDSKDLSMAIINDEADIVINWYATYTWDNNSEFMDVLNVPGLENTKKKLILAQLKSSNHPEISRKIIDYATSPEGQAIFKKHGFK